MTDDYYALLGVDPDASEAAILNAYRERVAEHHPDVSDSDDAGETFRRLNRAKDVLTDEARRNEYDSLGHERFLDRRGDVDRSPEESATRSEPATDSPARTNRRHAAASGGGTSGWDRWQTPGGSDGRGGLFGSHGPLDLRSFFRSSSPQAGRRAGSRRDHPSAQEAVECPKCRGRGRFVHELDTHLGRRRRIEPCERCGGDGKVDP